MRITPLWLMLLLLACSGGKKEKLDNSDDVSCVNAFVRSLYDGRFNDAETIMTTDAASAECMKQARFNYNQKMSKSTRFQYRNAAVRIKKEPVSDSVVIFICTDPVIEKNKPFKAVRRNNAWFIDFGYTCSGNL